MELKFRLSSHTFLEGRVVIGNEVTIKSNVYLWDGVESKDLAFFGHNVTFIKDIAPRSKQYPSEFLKTLIEKVASICANSTIIAGNIVGEYSMIVAGSVVTNNIPNNTLWYGYPCPL